MPQSDHWAVPYVVEAAVALDPASVLDVGVGMGQFGLHLRQALDIARGRLTKPEWKLRLDGVELFEPYRNPIWNYYYDSVVMADARTHLANLAGKYDLILICDVIEHFEKAEAEQVLMMPAKAAKWVLVTTPNGEYPQGALFGNDAETHRSIWTPRDFRAMGGFVHEIKATFLAVLPGDGVTQMKFKPGDFPTLFEHTAGSLLKCTRKWFPQMLRSRFGRS